MTSALAKIRSGRNRRPRGSGQAVMLDSYADANAWLTPKQMNVWRAQLSATYAYQVPSGYYGGVKLRANRDVWSSVDGALKAKNAGIPLALVLETLGESSERSRFAHSVVTSSQQQALTTVRTLEEANKVMAARLFAAMPMEAVRPAAQALGANMTAGDDKLRAVVAAHVALQANALGVVIDDWIELHKLDPNADPLSISFAATLPRQVTATPIGSGRNIFEQVGKFVRHPLKVLRALQTDIGAAIKNTMEDLMNTEKTIPWLSQFFLKPLGFHLQASLLYQMGAMLEDGTTRAFDEGMLIGDTADTLTAAGQALVVAGAALSLTGVGAIWGAAATALGALSIAAGNMLHRLNPATHRAAQAQADALAKAQQDYANAQANRNREVQQRALNQVNAGHWHEGWLDTPQGVRYWGGWTRHDVSSEWIPAWVWITDQGWTWTGLYN